MSSLWLLVKINLMHSFGLNKILKHKSNDNKSKNVIFNILGIIVGIMIFMFIFLYEYGLAQILKQFNGIHFFMILTFIVVTLFTLMTTINKAQGVLFSSKDFEMLITLPVSEKIILTSKVVYLLILNYTITSLILLPAGIIYFIEVQASPIIFVYLIASILVTPLIPIIISSILALIINKLSSGSRYKNIFLIIGGFISFGLIMFISTGMNGILTSMINEGLDELLNKIKFILPHIFFFTKAFAYGSIVDALLAMLVSIIPFYIFVIIFSKSYKKINLQNGESFKKGNYKLTTLEKSSKSKALYYKELKRYLASPIYTMNSSFGGFLLIIGGVLSFWGKDKMLAGLNGVPLPSNIFFIIALVAMLMFVSTIVTTNSSISIEGKNLWIIKSLPISTREIFKGKILLNLTISIPSIIISSTLILFGLELKIGEYLALLIIPSIFSIFCTIVGLIINLHFPKLDWTNEIAVVKQSKAVLISLLGGIVVLTILLAITVVLLQLSVAISLIIITIIILGLIALAWKYLDKNGDKLFRNID